MLFSKIRLLHTAILGESRLWYVSLLVACWWSASPVQAQQGYGLEFGGDSGYIEISGDNGLETQYTVEGWFKAEPHSATRRIFVIGFTYDTRIFMAASLLSDGTFRFLDQRPTGDPKYELITTETYDDGEWHHFAAVKSSNAAIRLYMDGALAVGPTSARNNGRYTDFIGFTMGRLHRGTTTSRLYKGQLDEIRYWNVARSETEINANKDIALTGSESGLEAYWPFDEGSGTTVADQTGNGFTGTLHGDISWVRLTPQVVADDPGNALAFGSDDEYVEANGVSAHLTNDFTLEAWIEPEAGQPSNGGAIWGLHTSDADNQMILMYDDSGDLFRYYDGGTSTTTAADYPSGRRYHVAVTVASGVVTVYVNGAAALTSTLSASIDATSQFSLGQEFDSGGPSNEYKGEMDEVRIWDLARSADEIRASMFTTLDGSESGLVSYYQFSESSGTTLSDGIGTNNGTLVNMEGDEWTTSSVVFGTSALQAVSATGTFVFQDVDLEVAVTDVTGAGTILGTLFSESPSTTPTASTIAHVYDDRYWVVDAYDFTSLTADLNLTLANDVSSFTPLQFKLYQRAGDDVSDWTFITSATAINGNTVTFSNVPPGGQFIVARVDTLPDAEPGNALSFDAGEYVQVNGVTENLTDDFTIEAWVQPSSTSGAGNDAIWGIYTSDNESEVVVFYDFDKNRFWIRYGEGDSYVSAGDYPPGRLYHVALVDEVSSSLGLALYVDGDLAISRETVAANAIDASDTFILGQHQDSTPSNEFAGLIDEVRVWGDARTADEIRGTMRSTLSGAETGLVAYYQFNETSGITAADVIGGYDGTLMGMSGDEWTTSNVALGTSDLHAVTTSGTVVFANADGALTTTSLDGTGSVVMTLLDEAPATVPAPLSLAEAFARYWMVTPYDMNSITGDLTFTLSSLNVTEPRLLKLFHRANETEDWAVATSASAINGNDVTFEGIDTFGHFLVAAFGQVTVDPGTMLYFGDGVQYVEAGSKSLIDPTAGTIELWFNPDDCSSGTFKPLIYGGEANADLGGHQDELYLYCSNDNVNLALYHGESLEWTASASGVTSGILHHVAVTWDADAGDVQLFLNGALGATIDYVVFNTDAWADHLRFGYHNSTSSQTDRNYQGYIDEIRIWRTARSQADIQTTMHARLTGLEQDLAAYWPLSEGEADTYATTTADIVGGRDGTLQDMVDSDNEVSPWNTSDVVLGTSHYQAVAAAGAYAFSDADVALNVTSLTGSGAIVSTLVDNAPASGPSTSATLYEQSWLVTPHDITSLTSNMTFTLPEDVSGSSPVQFKLFQRATPYASSWTFVGSASTIAGTDVTFDDVAEGGQFVVGRLERAPDLDRGNHLFFSGHDQYVRADEALDQVGSAFTLETWVRPSGDQQNDFSIIFRLGNPNLYVLYSKIDDTQGQFAFDWGDSCCRPKSTTIFEASTPYHLAVTRDGNQLQLYVNGILEVETDFSVNAVNDYFFMGGTGNFSNNGLRGHMDEVRVFREVRSVDDIRATMHSTLTGNEDGLVAYYQFNEDDGDTFVDVVSGQDATRVDGDSSVGVGGASIHLLGPGDAYSLTATGTYVFSNADLEMSVTSLNESGQVVAALIDDTPVTVPTSSAIDEVYDRFWMMQTFDLTHLSLADMTFTLAKDVSSYGAEHFKLFNLNSPFTGTWTFVSTATAINGSTVTFPIAFDNLNAGGQFVIARIDDTPNTIQQNALAFDGTDDYLHAHDVTKHLDDDFVLEAWVQPDATQPTDGGTIFAINAEDGSSLLRVLYDAAENRFAYYDGATSAFTSAIYPATFDYHIALRVEGGAAGLYVDGELALESTWSQSVDATALFSLGQVFQDSDLTAGAFYNGFMDEVRVWDRAHSVADIQAGRFTALDGTEAGLVLYYQFDETSGTTATDIVGGYDGTLVGTDDTSWQDVVVFGRSDVYVEAQGIHQLSNAGVDITYLSQNGVRVQVMRVDKAPDVTPTSTEAAIASIFDDQYWVMTRADEGLFNAILTFKPPFTSDDPFTSADEAVPDQVQLYTREAQGESWSWIASATSVDATNGTVTFREIRDFSEFIIVRADVLDTGTVTATDDVYENRVTITWSDIPPDASSLKITRDGTFLAYVASDETSYSDLTGDPDVTYTYCVIVTDIDDNELTSVCDTGRRMINPPTNVVATDGSLDTGVLLTWTDNSDVEAEYAVYRDGSALTTVATNTTTYLDETAVAETTYTYCVEAVDANAFTSAQACDDGFRGTILPPGVVTASDGQYPDRVAIAWTDQADNEDGYKVYRSTGVVNPGQSIVLDGSDDYVTFASTPDFTSFGGTYTIEMWFKSSDTASSVQYLFALVNSNTSHSVLVRLESDGRIRFLHRVPAGSSGGTSIYYDATDIRDGEWHHVAAVRDGDNMYLYVDGVVASSSLNDGLGAISESLDAAVGRAKPTTSSSYLEGEVDDLRIWNTARSATEISTNKDQQLEGTETGLVAYWPFEEGSGTSGADATGNGYTATLNGGTTWGTGAITQSGEAMVELATVVADVTSYDDTAAALGETYTYCVATVQGTGESIQVCDTGGIDILAAPTNIAASDDLYDDRIELTWTDPGDTESGFRIYRRDLSASDSTALFTTAADVRSYFDLAATAATDYRYCVVAVAFTDSDGDGTDDQEVESAPLCDAGRQAHVLDPSAVSATDGAHEDHVVLTWENPATTAALAEIYRAGALIKTTVATNLSYTDPAIASSDTLTYCVALRTTGGETSSPVCDDGHRVITPPNDVVATDDADESFVTITWVDNSSVEAGYNIYRVPENDTDAEPFLAGTTTASQATYSDLTGEPGVTYLYRVSAFDAYGESTYDEEAGRRTLLAPTELTASDGTSETDVALSWTDNSRIEDGYRIYRKTQGASDSTLIATTEARVTTYTDAVAADEIGVVFTYSIVAFDAYGTSTSITEDGSTMILAPSAFNASDSYADRIELAWIDLSEVESGYRIYRGTSASSLAELTTVNSDAIGYTDTGVSAGETYTYCIEAYNSSTASTCADAQDEGSLLEEITQTTDAILTGSIDDATSRGDQVGYGVALDGDYALVGAPQTDGTKGAAYIYQRVDGDWTYQRKLDDDEGCTLAPGDYAGASVALKGEYALVGAHNATTNQGYALLYQRSSDAWSCVQRFPSSDSNTGGYGHRVTLNSAYAFVSAHNEEPAKVYVYNLATGAAVTTIAHPLGEEKRNGFGLAMAASDTYLLVGAHSFDEDLSNAGTAYVYRIDTWTNPIARLVSSDLAVSDAFGNSVALSDTYALVGARKSDHSGLSENGAAYVFEIGSATTPWSGLSASADPTVINEDVKFTAATGENDQFGYAVALSDEWALIGALNDDNEASEDGTDASEAGAAFLYQFDGVDTWNFEEQIALTDAVDGDHFGFSVAVADGISVIGAPGRTSETGAVFFVDSGIASPDAPDFVTATDGTFNNRIQLAWGDPSDVESGFRIFRDGEVVTELSPNNTSYSDFDAAPGVLYTYCVETLSEVLSPSDQICDLGWRPPNGAISGRIAGEGGGGISEVDVCLAPTPNNALLFDGTGGYAQIPDDQSLDVGGTFTLETWVRYSDTGGTGTSDASLIEKADATSNITSFALRTARATNSNNHQLLCERRDADGVVVTVHSDAALMLNDDAWYHVACVGTQDASGGTLDLYVDGVLSNRTTFNSPLNDTSTDTDLFFGRLDGSDQTWFGGQLDEVRLWDYARTQADLEADMRMPLVGTEEGLLGYWPLDQEGMVLPNFAGRPNHVNLVNGVYLAETAAPLDVCGSTDVDGNYTISSIRYGESTTFTVTPGKDQRIFLPSSKTLTLNPESPVQNEVTFVDASAFTISGLVEYPSPFDSSVCPAESIELYIGAPGEDLEFGATSEADGFYSISADIGERVLEPRLTNTEDTGGDGVVHTFDPAFRTIDVQDDVTNVTFLDQTTRTLTGFVGGNCNTPIGPVKIKFFTANGCFEHEVEVEGSFSLDLPPQKYFAQVVELDPPDPLDKADVIAFFDNLGVQEIDLSVQSDTLELIYEAPLNVSISGFPTGQVCAADDKLGVPILTQQGFLEEGNSDEGIYDLVISVTQDYGDGNICPVEEGTITLFDEIGDGVGGAQELTLENGEAEYELTAGSPSLLEGLEVDGVDRSYQKALTVIADIEGRDPVTEIQWAVVKGSQTRTSEFVTLATNTVPLMVLRDPPGDGSYSFLSEGSTSCTTISNVTVADLSSQSSLEVKFGGKGPVGIGLGLGTIVMKLAETIKETTISAEAKAGLAGTQGAAFQVCTTVEDDYKTSSQENMVGADADVFLGVGFNLIFANADALTVKEADDVCSVEVSTIIEGGIARDEPFHTTYIYTQKHIRDNVIPTIDELISQSGEDNPSVVADGTSIPLLDARSNWYAQLDLNEKEKQTALNNQEVEVDLEDGEDPVEVEAPVRNLSFSAAAPYTHSSNVTTKSSTQYAVKAYVSTSSTTKAEFKVLGVGATTTFKVGLDLSHTFSYTTDDSDGFKTGYVLSDNDKGDSFTLDVGRDDRYDTFVFDLKSGVSSNPWEPGQEYSGAFEPCDDDPESFGCSLTQAAGYPFSQPRDKPTLSITPPERIGANPNEPALFTVGIGNESESQETRPYTLQSLLSENPYGAILRANGAPLDVGQTYRVDPGAVQNVTLEVERGPLKYDYDSLAVRVFPASEAFSPYADTVFFSVQFDAVCSDISILRPLNPWTRTVDDTGDMEIILHDFFLASLDVKVSELGVAYRRAGDATWLPIDKLVRQDGDDPDSDDDDYYTNDAADVFDLATTSFTTTWAPTTDGAYEMRAYTDCGSDAVLYSEITTGTVDTEAPLVFGKPEPADLVYHLGDNISASFNEDIACSTLVTSGASQNVFLTAPDGDDADTDPDVLEADVACDGRTFFLAPGSTVDLSDYESQVLTVTLTGGDTGLSDRFGNHLETDGSGNDVAWSFTVNQSGFAFSPRNIEIDVTRGTSATVATALVNGRSQPVTVSLDANLTLSADGEDDVDLTPSVTSGTMVANGSQAITFDIPDDLALGTWTGTLYASGQENGSIALGQAPFTLTANIVCQPPTTWTVDASQFEYSMTVTAQLFVDGVASVDVNDRIVAVVDNEIRGLGYVQEAATDVYRITMLVYSDLGGGELVNFQVWDDDTCTLYEDVTPTLAFVENAAHGTFAQPLTVQAPPVVDEQAIDLASGWTWFSVNTDATSTAVNDVLTDVVATDGDIVKNQSQFAFYDETFGWVGTLTDLVPGPTYLIHLQQSNPLLLSGTASDPAAPITLVEGWNWVGYLPDETLAINDALASITDDADANSLVAGDIIKSQYAFAEYVDESTGWIGSLTELQPGYGYQMNVSAAGTLTYPAPSPANALARVQEERMAAQEVAIQKLARIQPRILKDEVCERCESEPGKIIPTSTGKAESLDEAMPGPNWSIQPTVHAQTMTITVEIWRDGEALVHGGTQLALVDAEGTVRGLGRVEHVKALRKHLAFVVAYGDEEADEELTWQLYDAERDTVYEALGTLVFKANGRVGKVKEPFMLALDTSTALAEVDETQTLPDAFVLHAAYPNPFNPATTLRYELPQAEAVRLEVFDMLGRRVAVLVDEQQQAGRYTVRFDAEHLASGVYLYRIQAGGFVEVKQMVLLK